MCNIELRDNALKPGASFKYDLIAVILSPSKLIVCFEAVFRVCAIVKMVLDNLLKGEI